MSGVLHPGGFKYLFFSKYKPELLFSQFIFKNSTILVHIAQFRNIILSIFQQTYHFLLFFIVFFIHSAMMKPTNGNVFGNSSESWAFQKTPISINPIIFKEDQFYEKEKIDGSWSGSSDDCIHDNRMWQF